MEHKNNNKSTLLFNTLLASKSVHRFVKGAIVTLGMSFSVYANAASDLQESPLSLSLTTTAAMQIGDESHQLVISQYGILNKTTVSQMANMANHIVISQDGINNVANVTQEGYGNQINIAQLGDNNLAEVIQQGDENIANIQQLGEQGFIVHQIGSNMVINITQY